MDYNTDLGHQSKIAQCGSTEYAQGMSWFVLGLGAHLPDFKLGLIILLQIRLFS
jgi:hypothetical protein